MDERDMNELTGLRLDLEPDEVMSVVDALHAYLIKRIGWGLWNRAWRDLETADPASEVL